MKQLFTTAVLAAMLLAACSKDDSGAHRQPAVRIDPTIADPALFPKAATRVTDTDFESGDRIGVTITLTADGSKFLDNEEFAFDGSHFTAPGTLWYDDANAASSIFAYYPYRSGGTLPTEFAVLADQSGANYAASDLTVGVKTGVKPDRTVDVTFRHKMTRLIIRVTNGTDSDITRILIKGSVGTGTLDSETGAFTAKAGAATVDIQACERTKNQLYYALLVPQYAVKLETSVTTADGTTRPYTLGMTDLESGTNRELKMNIMPKDMEVTLGGRIDNWIDGEELEIDGSGAVQEPAGETVSWGGVDYKIVTLKDGRTWMAENLRYVPAGKTPSSDPKVDAGIWYPAANATPAAPDPSLVKERGLLYDAATAFGVDAITEDNAASLEGTQGICPDGWHIPTERELTGLVGHNANTSLNNTNAPYYEAAVSGARIDALNADGFNWTFAGVRNKTGSTATGSYLATASPAGSGDTVYGVMAYVWGSTFYKKNTETNFQFYAFMSTYNASNKKVTVAYGNYLSGYSVRCIKNAD